MSHYVLTVCMQEPKDGNIGAALEKVLAPYDENVEVERYRSYEDEAPADNWWYGSLKKDAEAVANNDRTRVKPYRPEEFGYSSAYDTQYTEAQQWENIQRDAEVFNSLPNPITNKALAEAYNRYYCEGFPHTDGTHLEYDEDEDKIYTWSTYNPKSKWDWYQVGGRWSDYFASRTDLTPEQGKRLIRGDRSWVSAPREMDKQNWVDGGPKGLLDFQYMRSLKEDEATHLWMEYHQLTDGLPYASSWTYVRETMFPDDIQAARQFYNDQPRVQAVKDNRNFSSFFGPCLIDLYGNDSDNELKLEKVERDARRNAVPGFALLTLEGEWYEPGKMLMFGASTDTPESTREFKDFANKYLDNLADDVLVISVDLHI